jgi:hypothetical protein
MRRDIEIKWRQMTSQAELNAIKAQYQAAKDGLDQANRSLWVVQRSLGRTQDDLDKQSIVELETALANTDRKSLICKSSYS